MLTDTHCHLDINQFDPDRDAVLERAAQVGVVRILIPGINLDSSRAAVKLAESKEMLYAAVGIHPTETFDIEHPMINDLRKLAQHPKVKGVGEIGLDYYWATTAHYLQQKVLKDQLDLAAEFRLPVVIHFREKNDAPDGECASDLLYILEEWTDKLRRGKSPLVERLGVLHSFSGSVETARRAISLHFYLGVTGPVTHRKDRQELIAALPLEQLLIETDAPYLAPVPQRGKRNEPAFVRHIADKIAVLQSCTVEEVEAATSANAARLFSWE